MKKYFGIYEKFLKECVSEHNACYERPVLFVGLVVSLKADLLTLYILNF